MWCAKIAVTGRTGIPEVVGLLTDPTSVGSAESRQPLSVLAAPGSRAESGNLRSLPVQPNRYPSNPSRQRPSDDSARTVAAGAGAPAEEVGCPWSASVVDSAGGGRVADLGGGAGRPVLAADSKPVGKVVDVVVGRDDTSVYPLVTGLLVRVGFRRVLVPVAQLADLTAVHATLASEGLDLAEFTCREGDTLLIRDVVDHQLVDVDGVRVIRASDLYLARVAERWRLVGVDVGLGTLARRLGRARWRSRATPDRVIDWAVVQPFGSTGTAVALTTANADLQRLRPAELADLLEDRRTGWSVLSLNRDHESGNEPHTLHGAF